MIPAVSLSRLETLFAQLERHGVRYGLGAKADAKNWNPQSDGTLNTPVSNIQYLDCSGFVRYALYHASGQQLKLPDGSQVQRAWCEQNGLHQVARYADAAAYMTEKRLFICFIKPFTNGCGETGHVWLLSHYDDGNNGTMAGTLESHGGGGVDSRPWNYRTLVQEVYSAYELPTAP